MLMYFMFLLYTHGGKKILFHIHWNGLYLLIGIYITQESKNGLLFAIALAPCFNKV